MRTKEAGMNEIEWLEHKHGVVNPTSRAMREARRRGIRVAILLIGKDEAEVRQIRDEKMEGKYRTRCDEDPGLHIAFWNGNVGFERRVNGEWARLGDDEHGDAEPEDEDIQWSTWRGQDDSGSEAR